MGILGDAVRVFGILFSLLSLFALGLLGGCAGSGPWGSDVKQQSQLHTSALHYAYVPVTPDVIKVLARFAPRLASEFADRRPPANIRFGIGDVLSVTIFEAQPGGLFIPAQAGVRPGNFINLPTQPVDEQGNISVPYAGTIRARRPHADRIAERDR